MRFLKKIMGLPSKLNEALPELERVSHAATIAAALVAIVAIFLGYSQFKQTQEQTRESQAYDLLMKYNELMADKMDRSTAKDWRDNEAFNISEAIYRLERKDPGWQETSKWMVSNQENYLKRTKIDCFSYDPGFIELARVKLASDQGVKYDFCER